MSENLGWNDPLPPGRDMDPVEPGEYLFRVVSWSRKVWERGKLIGANYAEVELELQNPQRTIVKVNLTLAASIINIVRSFFRSIGFDCRHGEPFVPRWNEIIGKFGWCEIDHYKHTDKDGNERVLNNLKKFLEPKGDTPKPESVPQHQNAVVADDEPPF